MYMLIILKSQVFTNIYIFSINYLKNKFLTFNIIKINYLNIFLYNLYKYNLYKR